MSAIRTADGCLVSDAEGQMARWAEYFEQLFKFNTPRGKLQPTGLQVANADPAINEAAPFLDEVRGCGKVNGWKGSWHL